MVGAEGGRSGAERRIACGTRRPCANRRASFPARIRPVQYDLRGPGPTGEQAISGDDRGKLRQVCLVANEMFSTRSIELVPSQFVDGAFVPNPQEGSALLGLLCEADDGLHVRQD